MDNFATWVGRKKKYIWLKADKATQQRLLDWCKFQGFDTSVNYDGTPRDNFTFHITIICSENEVIFKNGTYDIGVVKATPLSIEWLGENNDIPVIKVDCPPAKSLFDGYIEQGMETRFPEYLAHVSLSYAKTDPRKFTKVRVPDFPLYFDELRIQDYEKA